MIKKLKDSKLKGSHLVLLISTVALILVIYFFWYKPSHSQNVANSAPQAVEVSVIEVKTQNVQQSLELPARVAAFKISEIRPQVQGIVKERKFEEGSFVTKGTQLYQIDPDIYESAYESAKANYDNLIVKKKRYKNLLDLGGVSKQEFDDISMAFDNAKAELKRTKANFAYTKVYAPISGFIGKSNVTEGSLVTINQVEVLTTIAQLDPIYVDMVQSAEDNLKFGDQRGVKVSVTTENANYENSGVLKFSEVFADEGTDSVRLRAIFPNKDKKLLPGMFVSAKLTLKPTKAIVIPQRVTNRGPDGNLTVFVINKDNVAKIRPITATEAFGDLWIVTSGLSEGEIVVYEGTQKIVDGVKVKTVPAVIGDEAKSDKKNSKESKEENVNAEK